MPNLYNGYCYPSLQDIGNVVISEPMAITGEGVTTLSINGYPFDSVNYMVTYNTSSGSTWYRWFSQYYPPCTDVGKVNPDYSLPISDAILIGWGIVGLWLIGFFLKSKIKSIKFW